MWNNHSGNNVPPGLIQYKISTNDILGMDVDGFKETCENYTDGYVLDEQTIANLHRLTPNTKTGNSVKWEIITVVKQTKDTEIVYKGALRNTTTNEIALITSIDMKNPHIINSRMISSHDPDFKICWCKMIAPLCFWDDLNAKQGDCLNATRLYAPQAQVPPATPLLS